MIDIKKSAKDKIAISKRRNKILKSYTNNWQLYVLLILPLAYLIIFKYIPLLGLQIAFKNYSITKGMFASEWVGLEHFKNFFSDYRAIRVIKNTVILSVYHLVAGFPIPILFALCLNYITNKRYKKLVQTVSFAPYFISTVVMVTMIVQFLAPRRGMLTIFLNTLMGSEIDYLAQAKYFADIYVWSGIWKSIGFSSIIYFATLSGIPTELHEAAIIDGATKFKRMIHIDLPGILPTAIILFVLNTGQILNIGYEKVLLMQNSLNLAASEVISTYIYKVGLTSPIPQFSYSTAIGFFQSAIGLILIITVNKIANKISNQGLW